MTDINVGLAFAGYLSNPCAETIEAVVVALEGQLLQKIFRGAR
ncbi:hypothetical protein [Variovorax boronicumulans]